MKKLLHMMSFALALSVVGGFASCTEYLDKEPDSDVSTEAAFQNFKNFQGFVEEIYANVPHKEVLYWETAFNWGEDEYVPASCGHFVTRQLDAGNFRGWFGEGGAWGGSFFRNNNNGWAARDNNRMAHDIWRGSFYCIRKANLGLANMDLLVDATQEQKDAIRGQLLFFRAWWHEEVMNYLGGIPYIDTLLDGSERIKRPTYQECALKAAKDFGEAAKYLPNDWDKSSAGSATIGKNGLRITKATALAYQGKMLLFAASPLSEQTKEGGSNKLVGGDTYGYNKDLAQQAAEVLGECIALVESGKTPYELADYDYATVKDLTDHNNGSTTNSYDDIFYTVNSNWKQPGGKEAMMRGTPFSQQNAAAWGWANYWGPQVNGLACGSNAITPTANYIDYAYGMKNGLPLDDPASGWDRTHPFKDRDPRFYHDIIFDGVKYILADASSSDVKDFVYVRLDDEGTKDEYGAMRKEGSGSLTGYFLQKLVPHQWNKVDQWNSWAKGFFPYMPYLRLADVYLMYAEAGAAASGSSYKANSCSLTAVDAINKIRARVGVDPVSGDYLSGNKFIDCVRRERACELAFEGFRFNDLQRWLLLTESPYTLKLGASFKRVNDADWYTQNDPSEAEVTGYTVDKVIVERKYTAKHYWFPFMDNEVYLYNDFPQNPGW